MNSVKPAKPCIKCGWLERKTNGDCKACSKVRNLAWARANTEKTKASTARWAAANPEKRRAAAVARYAADPSKDKASHAARYAANPEKYRARQKAYRAKNLDKFKARCNEYRAANPEKIKIGRAKWAAANAEKRNASNAAWHLANPAAARRYTQNRRALKLANGGVLSRGLSAKLLTLQKGKCACCKQPLGSKYHLDHIMPLALGGTNSDSNIQLLHPACNQQKHAQHPIEFMQSRGFLL